MPVTAFLALLVAALRTVGVTHPAFQAAAHLYVGWLFGAYCGTRDGRYAGTAAALCVVEVVCFAASKLMGP